MKYIKALRNQGFFIENFLRFCPFERRRNDKLSEYCNLDRFLILIWSYLLRQFAVARVLLSACIFFLLKKQEKGYRFYQGYGLVFS